MDTLGCSELFATALTLSPCVPQLPSIMCSALPAKVTLPKPQLKEATLRHTVCKLSPLLKTIP